MSNRDERIDSYIENAQPFAQPILEHYRETVHEACPEVEEGIKWKYPHFMYKGKILTAMCAFKKHCGMGFWLESEMKTVREYTKDREKNGMFTLGKIEKLEDLPSKAKLIAAIKEAMELTDIGVTLKKAEPAKTALPVPDYFEKALKADKKAWEVFDKASPSFRKEYINWLTDAKTETTRNKRMEQAVEWISEGKARHWKYEKC